MKMHLYKFDQKLKRNPRVFRRAILGAFLLLAGTVPMVQAQSLLTYYNFNDASGSGSSANTATFTSDAPGLQTTTLTSTFATANVVAFNGTTLNRAPGDTAAAGLALALQTGTSNANNGKYIQFTVNATGAIGIDNGLTLSHAIQRSGTTSFTTETLSYSLDGSTFTTFNTLGTIPLAFATSAFALPTFDNTVDLSALTIRLTFDGSTSTSASANVRIDNIQLSEVPEPATYLGGILAASALGWSQRRRLLGLVGLAA